MTKLIRRPTDNEVIFQKKRTERVNLTVKKFFERSNMGVFASPRKYSKHPEGGAEAWSVVAGVFVAYGLAFGLLRVFSMLINPIKAYYGVSDTVAMMAPGLGMLGYSIGGLAGGGLLGIIGYREGSMIFGVVCAMAFFFCGIVDSIVLVLLGVFIALFALGVVYLAAPGIIGRYFHEKKTFANQLSACGVSVMQFILSPLLPIMVSAYTVKGCFIVISGIMLNIVAASALYRPTIIQSEVEAMKKKKDDIANANEGSEDSPGPGIDMGFFKHPAFLMFFFSQGLFFAGYMGCLLLVVPYAQGELGVDAATSAQLVMAMGVTELLFRIPFGWLGDWEKVNRTQLLAGTFLCLGILFIGFPLATNFTFLLVVAALSGIFQGGFGGLSFVVLDDIMVAIGSQESFMIGLGVSTGFNGILGVLAPVSFGMINGIFGNNTVSLWIAAIMVVVSAIMTFLIVPLTPSGPKFPKIPAKADFSSREDVAFIETKNN